MYKWISQHVSERLGSRHVGQIGQLHNIIVYIRRSTIRRNGFLSQIEVDVNKLPAMILIMTHVGLVPVT